MFKKRRSFWKPNDEPEAEVTTFNMYDLSWEEIIANGLDKHIDKETFLNNKNK